MNRLYSDYEKPANTKTKEQERQEIEDDVAKFLATGGAVTKHGIEENRGERVLKMGIPGHHTKRSFNP